MTLILLIGIILLFNWIAENVTAAGANYPVINNNTNGTASTGDSFTFSADVTDNGTVDEVYVIYWYGAGAKTNVSMTNLGGKWYEKAITLADTTTTSTTIFLRMIHRIIGVRPAIPITGL